MGKTSDLSLFAISGLTGEEEKQLRENYVRTILIWANLFRKICIRHVDNNETRVPVVPQFSTVILHLTSVCMELVLTN